MQKAASVLISVGVFLTIVVFERSVQDAFELPKFTLVLLAGLICFGALVLSPSRVRQIPSIVILSTGVLMVALVASATHASARQYSLWGQYSRHTGLLAYLAGILVFLFVASCRRRETSLLTAGMKAGLATHLAYVVVQVSDLDPFSWSSQAFSKFVIGTVGNPNTAAAVTALLLPYLLFQCKEESNVLRNVTVFLAIPVSSLAIFEFNSFQGNVGLLIVGLLIYWWELRSGRLPLTAFMVFLSLALILVVESRTTVIVGLLIIYVARIVIHGLNKRMSLLGRSLRRGNIHVVFGLSAILGCLVLYDRIYGQIESGMSERNAFFSAAIGMFRSSPILGRGLENYGLLFGQYRPLWNAVELENSMSSSAHSIPLGMLASGGLVLFCSAALFAFVISIRAIRILNSVASPQLYVAASISWLTSLIVSLVSVENILLLLLTLISAGMVVSGSIDGRRESRRSDRSVVWVLPIILVASLVMIFVPLKEYRSNQLVQANRRDLAANGVSDELLERAKDAVDLSSRKAVPLLALAEIEILRANREIGITYVASALKEFGYPPATMEGFVNLALQFGEIDVAREIVDGSLSHNPNSPTVLRQGEEFYRDLGTTFERQGYVQAAVEAELRASEISNRRAYLGLDQ